MFGKKRRFRKFYLLFFFGVVFFLVHRFLFSFSSVVSVVSSTISYPVIFVQKKIVFPIKSYLAYKKQTKELDQFLIDLQQENERLLSENIKFRAAAAYQKDTKELIEFKKKYDVEDAIVAQIIFRQLNDEAHFLLLDKGSTHGIYKDMVAVYKNNLLGKVTEVHPFYSKLALISDRSCKVAAHCAQTKASGIHTGQNNKNSCALERVSHLCKVQKEDLVLSSGEGLIFPRGFALGRVSSVASDGLCLLVEVSPAVDISALNYCCLIKKGQVST